MIFLPVIKSDFYPKEKQRDAFIKNAFNYMLIFSRDTD